MIPFAKAVVHIGLHKTGTTSIQEMLFANRALLAEEHKFLYPAFAANHSYWLESIFRPEGPAGSLLNLREGHATAAAALAAGQKRLAEIEREMHASACPKLLLSGESLSVLGRDGVARFKEWILRHVREVRVLVYLREPVGWFTSCIQENIKGGGTLESILSHPRSLLHVRQRVEPWIEAFGRDAIAGEDFDRARSRPNGIVGSFCELAGIGATFLDKARGADPMNASMAHTAALLLSTLNELQPLVQNGVLNPLRDESVTNTFYKLQGRRFSLPKTFLERSLAESQDAARWIEATFGLRYDLAPTLPEEKPEIYMDPAARQSLALTLASLVRDSCLPAQQQKITELRAKNKRLRERIESIKAGSSTPSTWIERFVRPLLKLERSIRKRL